MTLQVAIEILKEFNKWRNGEDIAMIPHKVVTHAIDIIIKYFKFTIFTEMSLNKAIEVLKQHNDWRTGKTNEMIPPIIITHAIEIIIKHYERKQSK